MTRHSWTARAVALGHEGYRLFFVLGAAYGAMFPLMWVLAFKFDLPLAHSVPAALWHGHEMLVGAFGAALIGFLTTAAPEWTNTAPPRGRVLWGLATLWGLGRAVGLLGWDGAAGPGALADLAWMAALLVWLLRLSWRRRTDRLLGFAFWLALLIGCVGAARWGFAVRDMARAAQGLHLAGFAFLGLLGLALARITVPVTNLVLDPTEHSSPYRPHPGRLHLAPGLVLVALGGEAAGVSPAVSGYLMIAAGAAFMDRVAEAFIGREIMRTEILMLAGSSALAGAGLLMSGAARLGAPWGAIAGDHIAFMGGLGVAVYAVFCIASRLHSNLPLRLTRPLRIGALAVAVSAIVRVLPDLGMAVPGPLHGIAAGLWAAGFLIWVYEFWPVLSAPPSGT